jgi:hypothetical protein
VAPAVALRADDGGPYADYRSYVAQPPSAVRTDLSAFGSVILSAAKDPFEQQTDRIVIPSGARNLHFPMTRSPDGSIPNLLHPLK